LFDQWPSLAGFDWTWSYWPNQLEKTGEKKAFFSSKTEIFKIKIGGEVTFPCIVVNLGEFVRDLEDHDWRRGHLSLYCCQPR
jgi:hypothetical protein